MPNKRRKPIGLVKRNATSSAATSDKRKTKKSKTASKATGKEPPVPKQSKHDEPQHVYWSCQSEIDRQAAACVGKLLAADASKRGGTSIKALALAPHINAKKAVYAVTCQTLQYLPVIQNLHSKAFSASESHLRPAVAYVLMYEMLFGQGCRVKGKAEKAVYAVKAELQQHLQELLSSAGVSNASELLTTSIAATWPRTARVNLLKMTVSEVLSWLRSPPAPHQKLAKLGASVTVDKHLPDVLCFPAGTDLHDHPLVASSCLILQSKASCLPAHCLQPKPGWHVLDACAAPGNKTTHVAALMGGQGCVWAFDRDQKRLQRLTANATATGASNIVAQQADFLTLDMASEELSEVRGVILDPSCSGSGTRHSRMDHLLPSKGLASEADEASRLASLAAFQEKALRHALTLPKLERLVYSTCSVHDVENELVVKAALEYAEELGFELGHPLPDWPRRGRPLLPGHDHLIRIDPEEDQTDGFFVAIFQRKKHAAAS